MNQYDPNQPFQQQPFNPAQHQAPKQGHRVRNTLFAVGGVFVGLIILLAVIGSTVDTPTTNAADDKPATQITVPGPTVTITETAAPEAAVTVTAPPVTVTKPAPPAKTVTAAPPQAPAAMEEPGTYMVGTDVKPGTYKSEGGEGCYWERLKSLDGGFTAIIANDFVDGGTTIVTIKKTDKAFKFNDCAGFVKIK